MSHPLSIEPAIPPYLYECLWQVAIYGPLTADEIACHHNMPAATWDKWTAQACANRLRSLVHHGLLARSSDGFYTLTLGGRAWLGG